MGTGLLYTFMSTGLGRAFSMSTGVVNVFMSAGIRSAFIRTGLMSAFISTGLVSTAS